MKVIAFAPKWNSPGKKDATGAFQPEAARFVQYHGVDSSDGVFLFDNHQSKLGMRNSVLNWIGKHRALDAIAFFCHGTKRGLQCGFDEKTVRALATEIEHASFSSSRIVPLYACDTGRDIDANRLDDLEEFGGDGGFADQLRDALCLAGIATCRATDCRVDAHTTAGHTSRNPNVRRFEGEGSTAGGIGGYYIVPFRSRLWKRWVAALKTDFRFQFPFMTATEIHNYLSIP